MKRGLILVWLLGVALFIGLLAYRGFAPVSAVVATSGWGLLVITMFHVGPLAADAVAWRVLFEDNRPLPILPALRIRWIGESVNQLLPAAQLGGDFVRARLASHRGVPGVIAGASVVADLTLGVMTQIVFSLLGLFLLIQHEGGRGTVYGAVIGLAIVTVLVVAFYVVQRSGLFGFLTRVLGFVARGRDWLTLAGSAKALDDAIKSLYRRRRDLLVCCFWHLVSWIGGAGEVWLALYFLGHPVTVWEAVILESLAHMIRSAAFFVPGALGVQEGGIMVLGAVIGLGPDVSLALSLIKRVRELLLGLPGLIAWQATEGRRLWPARD